MIVCCHLCVCRVTFVVIGLVLWHVVIYVMWSCFFVVVIDVIGVCCYLCDYCVIFGMICYYQPYGMLLFM